LFKFNRTFRIAQVPTRYHFAPVRIFLVPSLFFLSSLFLAADSRAEGYPKLFTEKIQPILRENCFKCHSHSSEKIKGGLVLDSRDAVLTGGDTGPAVTPGDPEKSLLIEAVRYANEDLQMPPKGKKLTEEQVALLTEWVKQGAPWPEEKGQRMTTRPKGKITDEDRNWWSFQPLRSVEPPAEDSWCANEIDRFILARVRAEQLQPAPRADKAKLLRRVYFDVIGLPPTPEQTADFVTNDSPQAWEKAVDQLLADPRYGEHWARHWLDLVRYADSDGYRVDDYRPNAWHYRDYVIRALNSDKPYDRFVQEQLAGDELWPDDLEARVATGYLCHWIYEYNSRDAVGQWTNILNDITDTTADVFMGVGLQCARCHDHKFDPILQKDYYRLQAFFAPILPYAEDDVATPQERDGFAKKQADWEAKTADLRAQLEVLEKPYREKAAEEAKNKFPKETQAILNKPVSERTPYERQIGDLAYRQVLYEWTPKRFEARIKEPEKTKRNGLLAKLNQQYLKDKPAPLPVAPRATDVGPVAPPVTIPKKAQFGEIEPGFLTLLDERPATILTGFSQSTGRRATLAKWLTRPDNPLTARVIVNRVWQYHFGRGLAPFASDFGKLGEQPSHPELLDWLARRFVQEGWSFKKLHRLILNSATYQQSAANPIAEQARLKDPENRLLWQMSTRRLDAEQIRDAVLAVTGELRERSGGEGVNADQPVRTIYNKVIRNTHDPVLEVFDAPEAFSSVSQRNVTTTPTQSLLMIHSKWSLERARAFANRLRAENSSDEGEIVSDAIRITFGREPQAEELSRGLTFLARQTQAIESSQPPSRVAPFVDEKRACRAGHAASFIPRSGQERFIVPDSPSLPKADFTIEAFVMLRSVYSDAKVRTIVSQWDGNKGHPGWSLGVTGMTSRNKPQTLVLQLSGDQPWSPSDPIEPVFSGMHIDLNKPYYIAVSVDLDDATEKGIIFYAKDLSNDDEPLKVINAAHTVTSGIRGDVPLFIGGRAGTTEHVFDGLIDDLRISNIPLRQEQLLFTSAALNEHTVGYWKFEPDPGPYEDSSPVGNDITAPTVAGPRVEPRTAALVDFCHVLLNSNEFLYID
jgi:hypothetical protein